MKWTRFKLFWISFVLALIVFLALVIFAPEVFYCQPLAYRILRYIPDGCLRWTP